MRISPKYILLFIFLLMFCSLKAQWTHEITMTHKERDRTNLVRVWYDTPKIKGFLLSGSIGNAYSFCTDDSLRKYLKENELGIVYIRTSDFRMAIFDYKKDSAFFYQVLDTVSTISGMPEFKYAPWVVFGHSTDGLFAQNVSLWRPERTMGILYHKSGNLGNVTNMHAPYTNLSPLKDIPFLAINGRYEQYGPNGNLKPGESKETQWWAMRDTLIKLRKQDYLVNMIVDHYGLADHNSYSTETYSFMSRFVNRIAKAQLPEGYPTSAPIPLNRISATTGWLSDTSVSHLIDSSALPDPLVGSYSEYSLLLKENSFWHINEDAAVDWINYHHGAHGVITSVDYFPPQPTGKKGKDLYYNVINEKLELYSKHQITPLNLYDVGARQQPLRVLLTNPYMALDIEELKPGIYFLKLLVDNKIVIIKFIK